MSLQETPTPSVREIRAEGPDGDPEALRRAYLDLLKLCLCDLTGTATQTVSWTGDRRVFYRELPDEQLEWRISGRDWPLNALTMTGLRRLDDLQACVESVVESGISGDLVEAGAWRGGSSILMRATLDALGEGERTVWVADSFSGFPAPEPSGVDEDRELEAEMGPLAYLAPSLEQVRGYFERFGLGSGVRFVPGFFEDTMRQLRGHRWSVVRLDADTYKATRLTLEALYPGLSVGGYVISDDYAFLPACRRAVDDFRAEHGVTEQIEQIDHNAVRWRRERPAAGGWPDEVQRSEQPPGPRATVAPTVERVPSARELELSDELAALRAQLAAVQADIDALRGAPWTAGKEWLSRRFGRS